MSCAAVGCKNRGTQGFMMHNFPRDPERRAIWASMVKRLNWVPTNASRLCEVHFEPDQWEKVRVDGTKRLKCSAVPTLFSNTTLKPKRKARKVRHVRRSVPKNLKTSQEQCQTGSIEENVTTCNEEQLQEERITTPEQEQLQENVSVEVQITVCEQENVSLEDHIYSTCVRERLEENDETNEKFSSLIKQHEDKINELTLLLKQKDVHIMRLSQKLVECERKMIKQSSQLSTCRTKLNAWYIEKQQQIKSNPLNIFREDQLRALSVKSMNYSKWSDETVNEALGLKLTCGRKGYKNLLRLKLPYPSLRTLSRRLESSGDLQSLDMSQSMAVPQSLDVCQGLDKPQNLPVPQNLDKSQCLDIPQNLAVPQFLAVPLILAIPPSQDKPQSLGVSQILDKPQSLTVPQNLASPQILAAREGLDKPQNLAVPQILDKVQDLDKPQDMAVCQGLDKPPDLEMSQSLDIPQNLTVPLIPAILQSQDKSQSGCSTEPGYAIEPGCVPESGPIVD